jgi:hypothetical protein
MREEGGGWVVRARHLEQLVMRIVDWLKEPCILASHTVGCRR